MGSERCVLIPARLNYSIAAESGACPISFTNLEMELHEAEMELLEGLGKIMRQLQDENMIPLG